MNPKYIRCQIKKQDLNSYYNFPGMITDFNFLIGIGSYTENLDDIQ
jgi:hypothetical protein